MKCAGAEAERNTKNAILWKMKGMQIRDERHVAEKPEALNELSSA